MPRFGLGCCSRCRHSYRALLMQSSHTRAHSLQSFHVRVQGAATQTLPIEQAAGFSGATMVCSVQCVLCACAGERNHRHRYARRCQP